MKVSGATNNLWEYHPASAAVIRRPRSLFGFSFFAEDSFSFCVGCESPDVLFSIAILYLGFKDLGRQLLTVKQYRQLIAARTWQPQ